VVDRCSHLADAQVEAYSDASEHLCEGEKDLRVHQEDLRKTRLRFECFPYVCPEPVLVECSFLYKEWRKRRVFRTSSVGTQVIPSANQATQMLPSLDRIDVKSRWSHALPRVVAEF
jgi:hypothetical protein